MIIDSEISLLFGEGWAVFTIKTHTMFSKCSFYILDFIYCGGGLAGNPHDGEGNSACGSINKTHFCVWWNIQQFGVTINSEHFLTGSVNKQLEASLRKLFTKYTR